MESFQMIQIYVKRRAIRLLCFMFYIETRYEHRFVCRDIENGCGKCIELNKWSKHEGNKILNRSKWADGCEENRKCTTEQRFFVFFGMNAMLRYSLLNDTYGCMCVCVDSRKIPTHQQPEQQLQHSIKFCGMRRSTIATQEKMLANMVSEKQIEFLFFYAIFERECVCMTSIEYVCDFI